MKMIVKKYDFNFTGYMQLLALRGQLWVSCWFYETITFIVVAILQLNMVGGKNGGVYSSAAPLSPETFRYFQVL